MAERSRNRHGLRQVGAMIQALAEGRRPSSFILHGEADLRAIGFGLEGLAEQREKLERQISHEEFNLRAILSSMVEAVMVVNTERVIRMVNHSFLTLFELHSEPLGQSVLQTLRNATVEDVIRTALSSREPQSREITILSGDRHFAMNAAPVRDASGEVLGVAAIFHDITRLKQLEQVRKEFVANVSHELRTPLSIFQGYLEMLQDTPELTRDEIVHTVEVLQKHSNRLNALVEDLLTLARLEARSDALEKMPLNLTKFLNGLAADWKIKMGAKRIRLRLDVPEDLPEILADSFRLEQVFYNLLENALKYTPVDGEIAIEAQRFSPGMLEVRVKDTGSGIPTADVPHIFERFYRADKARSRALGGTGLGLSIVKHIAQLHGGSVRAESVYGYGTTICVRLPYISMPQSAAAQEIA